MGGHPRHRVDLAAELGHEERIHHRRRRQTKPDRCSRRDDQLIDGGDTLIGVDEQPFPIERGDVDLERLGVRGDRRPRIELMGADPADPAQQDHDQRRDRPDDKIDTPFIGQFLAPSGAGIGRPVPPGESQGRQDHRNHDHEHDFGRVDQQKQLRRGDRPLRIEYAGPVTGSDQECRAYGPANTTRARAPRVRCGSLRCIGGRVTPVVHRASGTEGGTENAGCVAPNP